MNRKTEEVDRPEAYPPITVRNITLDEMALIDQAASESGRTRASWIRDRLKKAAKKETGSPWR